MKLILALIPAMLTASLAFAEPEKPNNPLADGTTWRDLKGDVVGEAAILDGCRPVLRHRALPRQRRRDGAGHDRADGRGGGPDRIPQAGDRREPGAGGRGNPLRPRDGTAEIRNPRARQPIFERPRDRRNASGAFS
jgi:hypothetical protein